MEAVVGTGESEEGVGDGLNVSEEFGEMVGAFEEDAATLVADRASEVDESIAALEEDWLRSEGVEEGTVLGGVEVGGRVGAGSELDEDSDSVED